MASHGQDVPGKHSNAKQDRSTPRRMSKVSQTSSQPSREGRAKKVAQDVEGLKEYVRIDSFKPSNSRD